MERQKRISSRIHCMHTLSKILRLISLSLLSGGSAAVVFCAVVLVKAATASGVPVAEAAATNAPVFIQYSKVASVAALFLLVAELAGFSQTAQKGKLDLARFAASLACIVCVGIFAFGIVPPMERLLPDIKTVTEAHEQFRHLHEASRSVFGASILFAFLSLILPVFKKEESDGKQTKIESKVLL